AVCAGRTRNPSPPTHCGLRPSTTPRKAPQHPRKLRISEAHSPVFSGLFYSVRSRVPYRFDGLYDFITYLSYGNGSCKSSFAVIVEIDLRSLRALRERVAFGPREMFVPGYSDSRLSQ